ncbi:ABC transporter ATP-binding protein [Anaplasma capra]|uniref:ABC transporter ATP-binding protein n=1 Tax=Anaplasma capra TaxID=1562740 RepID=UPI0021D5AC2B|nr:ABC transporter ATP-binding protein/permease [Anaplasma capra]MCU7611714.1 ABC transporter ATP-binding protein/permease [Anaplasma capra]MCU7612535.1 ABC transporter ATP-binding protein/permease [Anaplasma capra]
MRVLLSYIRPHLLYFLLSYVVTVTSSLAILALGRGMHVLVDSSLLDTGSNIKPLLTVLSLIVTMAASSFLRIWLSGRGAELVVRDLRKRLYGKIINLSQSVLENTSISMLTGRLTTDTTVLHTILSGSMLVILRNITVFVGSLVMLIHTNLKLTGHVVLALPALFAIVAVLGKRVKHFSRVLREKAEKLAHFSEETCRGIGVIQAFTAEEQAKAKFTKLLDETFRIAEKYTILRALLVTLILSSAAGSIGVVLWMGINEVSAQHISAGSLLSFVFYAALAAGAVNSIGDNMQDLQKAAGIAEDISKLLCMDVGMSDVEGCVDVSEIKDAVSMNSVTFFYPSNADTPALHDVSITMRKGEKVAIVGYSGAGKSTVADLLLRFYDVSSGSITIDGVDIRKISLRSLRSLFCIVPQSPIIFSGTIRDNITYGIEGVYTDAQLAEVAEQASIADFIYGLPDKFDTFVGERGMCLSEGQRQRIAIARTIARRPEALILDEATSALDSDNENKVQTALYELMRGKLVIVIAHRLSTVTGADKIVVLNNGVVKEVGSHNALMRDENSLYARLVKLQLLQHKS